MREAEEHSHQGGGRGADGPCRESGVAGPTTAGQEAPAGGLRAMEETPGAARGREATGQRVQLRPPGLSARLLC